MANSNNILGTLSRSPNGDWVTFKEAKHQVRLLAKEKGHVIGLFRPRSHNKQALQVPLADGSGVISVMRRVGAPVTVTREVKASDISADLMAEIMAQEARRG